ncbi:MAG TPA: enoyl-CoA hydratase [Stellaceae bacterium]|nr:enoyl-CoA hydratase [Stellaceae bacterium]
MPGLSVALHDRGEARVAILVVDNEQKLNILGRDLIASLTQEVRALAHDRRLRALVLRGAGEKAFIGGADIREMATLDRKSAREFIAALHGACDSLRRLPVPVIARIEGYALGAGLEIAAACDLRIAGSRAKFGMPEVKVGIPSVIEAVLLPQLIGWGRTRRLLLTGEMIDAAEAERWGLVEWCVPERELDATVDAVLGAILSCGPQALQLQKALIRDWEGVSPSAAVDLGIESFVRAFETDEPVRMMRAFLAAAAARRR